MDLLNIAFIICITSIIGIGWFYIMYKPYRQRQIIKNWLATPYIKHYLEIMETLYAGVDPFSVARESIKKHHINDAAFTYGEIDPLTLSLVLDIAKPKCSDIFYDLGSGAGIAVIGTALLYDVKKCYGVELLPELNQLAKKRAEKLPTLDIVKKYYPNKKFDIECIEADLLTYNWSDADIIFINATCYSIHTWQMICQKCESLKVGTRIIIGTKHLTSRNFELLDSRFRLMSWGTAMVYIYHKTF